MEYLLLAVAVLLGCVKATLTKIVKKEEASLSATAYINVVTFSAAFVVIFFLGIGSVNTFFQVPWLLAALYAVCTLGSQIALMKAVELGSVSVSSLFYSCGFILPTVWGSVYYHERLNAFHVLGLLCIVGSFVCSVKKEEGKSFNLAWLIAALGGLLFAGCVGIMQKLFASDYTQYKLDNFLCVAFLWIIGFSLLLFAAAKYRERLALRQQQSGANAAEERTAERTEKRARETATETPAPPFVQKLRQGKWALPILTVTLGGIIGLANKVNTYLSGVMPSVLFFPVVNGGTIIFTAVFSMALFKEKLSLRQKLGLLIGIAGILLITVGKAVA